MTSSVTLPLTHQVSFIPVVLSRHEIQTNAVLMRWTIAACQRM
jgi:hypothetical protein